VIFLPVPGITGVHLYAQLRHLSFTFLNKFLKPLNVLCKFSRNLMGRNPSFSEFPGAEPKTRTSASGVPRETPLGNGEAGQGPMLVSPRSRKCWRSSFWSPLGDHIEPTSALCPLRVRKLEASHLS
jgi:hypothetical protein